MLVYRRVSPSQLPLVIKHCLLEKPPFSSMIFAANQTSHVLADFPATNLSIFTDTGGYIPTLSQCSLSHFINNSLSFSIIYHHLASFTPWLANPMHSKLRTSTRFSQLGRGRLPGLPGVFSWWSRRLPSLGSRWLGLAWKGVDVALGPDY